MSFFSEKGSLSSTKYKLTKRKTNSKYQNKTDNLKNFEKHQQELAHAYNQEKIELLKTTVLTKIQ